MKFKTISDLGSAFKDKRVLVRSDLNSPIVNGKVQDNERIRASTETIKELKKKKAKIVILAHQGRKGKKDYTSLKQHAQLLNKYTKVKFVNDVIGVKAINAIKKLKSGEALLLDNVRSLEQEYYPDRSEFERYLVPLFDIYINDAFSVCHRNHASVVSFPRYLKQRGMGRLLEKELEALDKLRVKGKQGLYILGGIKAEDNVKLLKGSRKIIAGGLFDFTCLSAKGIKLGASDKFVDKKFLKKYKNKLKKVKTSFDFAVKVSGKRKEISVGELPVKGYLGDVGEKTMESIKAEIKKAKTVFVKGPLGKYEDEIFLKGTKEVLKELARYKGKKFVLLGGGNLNDALKKSGINKNKFGYVSLAGGALIAYLAGEKLPGLESLKGR